MSSFTNFDNLLLQTLMGRLQIHPPPPSRNPFLSQSLEDLLFNVDDSSDDDDTSKTQLSKEESKLEKEIIRVILSGKTDSLKPNSGQAVTVGEHHICVGFHEEKGSDYRVWEWHGHIMLFDEENGYTPEYIYGNYFERHLGKTAAATAPKQEQEENEDEEEEKIGNLGLRELIDGGDSAAARILHRNICAGSSSGLQLATHRVVVLEMMFISCVLVIVESDQVQLRQVGEISEGNHVVAPVMKHFLNAILLKLPLLLLDRISRPYFGSINAINLIKVCGLTNIVILMEGKGIEESRLLFLPLEPVALVLLFFKHSLSSPRTGAKGVYGVLLGRQVYTRGFVLDFAVSFSGMAEGAVDLTLLTKSSLQCGRESYSLEGGILYKTTADLKKWVEKRNRKHLEHG
ncbi:unnamed protein product [Dovyalis caffra]|uniref:Uncharacterized protein n=1 Tax=Dovyalis caffra TaxID=77055 RepID=A0AAV1RD24_9ROSI|nr:unnamed protein product [Dovyalis caffra]